jgi:ERCC4-type nuclease
MTLLVDDRAGSHELVKPLRKLGLPVEETRLESADVMFEGRGEKGASVLIGIEYKKLGELVQALRTERLQGHQLLKMQAAYDFNYLLIEGEVRYGPSGLLTQKARYGRREDRAIPGKMGVGELLKRLHVLHLRGGLTPLFARALSDTLQQITALYRVWTDCALDEHKSHIAIYRPPALVPVSEFRVFMQSLNGVGFVASKAAEAHFGGNIQKAVNATAQEWQQVEGIGIKLSHRIVRTFRGV